MERKLNRADPEVNKDIRLEAAKLSRQAKRVYFGTHIRDEVKDGKPAFDLYEVVPQSVCSKLTSHINNHLDDDGEIVVLDLPYPDRDTVRTQLLTKNYYINQKSGLITITRNMVTLPIKTRVSQRILNKNVEGALDFEVRGGVGKSWDQLLHIRTTSYNEEETPGRRFAILSHSQKGWKLLVDFRWDDEPGGAIWKVNPGVLY